MVLPSSIKSEKAPSNHSFKRRLRWEASSFDFCREDGFCSTRMGRRKAAVRAIDSTVEPSA